MVDEHRDRPLHRPRELEHRLEHVAVRVFEIDDDDVGLDLGNPPGDSRHVVNDGHPLVPRLPQAGLDDRRADAVLIDDEDAERRGDHAAILPSAAYCAMRKTSSRLFRLARQLRLYEHEDQQEHAADH